MNSSTQPDNTTHSVEVRVPKTKEPFYYTRDSIQGLQERLDRKRLANETD
jgi:hypothetical protein